MAATAKASSLSMSEVHMALRHVSEHRVSVHSDDLALDDVIGFAKEHERSPWRRAHEHAVRLARVGHPQQHILRGVHEEAADAECELGQRSELHVAAVTALAIGVVLQLEVA